MQFCKMNGAGNDFLILNNIEENLPHSVFPELARILCHRRLSIGADGLMVVERTETDADYRMLFYNADGSAGEMCGNGARCICRYGYEKGLSGEMQTVETPSGMVKGWRIDSRNYRIRLTDPSVIRLDCPVEACGEVWQCSYVELGVPGLPHAVVPVKGLVHKTMDELRELGRTLRFHSAFPKGANINFYDITAPNELVLLTYERGVEDFTYACGTGTGSTVLVLTLMGHISGQDTVVKNSGGTLSVRIDRSGEKIDHIWLTGPTNFVCEGNVRDEDVVVDFEGGKL
ncbi:MAG: diaminopimelate epimerase [Oscillospiraceae bacterium]|nr:diaminopimelate epimerase [Oscillospiraceae bacterium]